MKERPAKETVLNHNYHLFKNTMKEVTAARRKKYGGDKGTVETNSEIKRTINNR